MEGPRIFGVGTSGNKAPAYPAAVRVHVDSLLASHLARKLPQFKEQLRPAIERYETSPKDIRVDDRGPQASDQALGSTSEELKTCREELQSIDQRVETGMPAERGLQAFGSLPACFPARP